ncbi:Anaerobic dehydrogenases, typically selenocysteine-containing [[Actinomadura] parvosata subsp. kistnae]|uniref:Oxidoreductase n=1 Tax=[Actinomadura] parvosata subsp. kistnae TaxID=1909395 RepID=A0A1V0A035_9ACTN|nr:molybdopterin-dependent oxidoreductase [Nonomuraea sp. ATCC 55076]AQZ63581.1 oxidoreductase [Nonomuraea sp. ATCC 55076]SPL99351.1 Anaerobic dehydrogenases, typically selenocysteine-containing [Actinomadura parvosata subsp. kistnae]
MNEPRPDPPSRRSVLRGAVLGGTGAIAGALPTLVPYAAQAAPATGDASMPDFTEGSAALRPDRTVAGACQFCNCDCRLEIRMKAGRIIDVRGERADPVQDGNLCVKASMMPQLAYNPLRLTSPLRRTGGAKGDPDSRFEPVTWDTALDLIATRFLDLRDSGEARAIANRTTGRMPRGAGALAHRLFSLLGSPNDTDVGPVCNDAGGNALAVTFGLGNFTNGYGVDPTTGREDLGAARYLLMLGTNQAETHPVTFAYLLRARQRTRARLVVVDPRRTPTGALADDWIAPKPHTDLALVLGMLHEVISEELHDRAFVRQWVVGFEELRDHVTGKGYTPEWAAGVTGVAATTIRRIAREYATAKPAAIFCNAGISHQLGAFDTYRAIAMLAAITGNVGVPGGGCNFMHNTWPGELGLPPLKAGVPEPGPALPVGPDAFADAILTGRPYRLRAVMTEGNPLISSANTGKVRRALEKLDFYVYTGLFMEEAAHYADVILPVCSGMEFEGVYMRRDDRAIRWQDAAVPRVGESRSDTEIFIGLAHALARNDRRHPPAYWTDALPLEWTDYNKLWAAFVANTPSAAGMTRDRLRARTEPLRWPCPATGHPGVSTLYLDHPSWYQAARSLGSGNRFLTPSGKVEIFTTALESRLAPSGHGALPVFFTHPEVTGAHPTLTYGDAFVTNPVNPHALTRPVRLGTPGDGRVHRRYPLMGMTGRPSVVHFAGVTHWTYTGEQLNGIRLIQIHPDTAARYGIADGDAVLVESPRGAVTGTALIEPGIRTDTIFLPNTFGPAQKVGDIFGDPHYEAANTLVDDQFYDNLSGQQAYKCFACRLRKVP